MDAELRQFDPKSPEFHDRVVERMVPFGGEFLRVRDRIDQHYSQKLCDEAERLDVEVPEHDETGMWRLLQSSPSGDDIALTPKGRHALRKLVDAEKARRFEVRTLWLMKFWLPLLASLVGIIGALTGLIAVLQHKK